MIDKPTAEARRGLRNVLALCTKISDNTKADCFFSYEPHCKSYSVYIHRDGWKPGEIGEYIINTVTDITSENVAKTCAKLKEIYKELKENEENV